MSLLLAVIFTGIVQVAGLALMVWFLVQSLEQQNKTVQTLAMFKKSTNVNELAATVAIMEEPVNEMPAMTDAVKEEHFYPHELDGDALTAIRSQM